MPQRKKKPAGEILSGNLKKLMAQSEDLRSSRQMAEKSGLGAKTVNNAVAGRHNCTLETVEQIARVFRLDAYQLLCPAEDIVLLTLILSAYNDGGETGRNLLRAAAQTALLNAQGNVSGTYNAGKGDAERS